MKRKKKQFEDLYETIDQVIKKRKNKWKLNAITWFDFEDIEQIIKLHIYKKWHLWDQTRAIEPWVNRIATNQIRNIIRNNYTAYAKPCLSCSFNQNKESEYSGEFSCGFTKSKIQCAECPLYAKWEKIKKPAYDVKITVSLENHKNYFATIQTEENHDYKDAEKKLHDLMKINLSDKHFFIYKMFFIDHLSDEEIASILRFKTNEKNRKAGYKQIKNLKKMLFLKAQDLLKNNDVF